MEYTSPTCLNTFMRGRPFKRINEDEAKVIFRQIVDAIAYIHQFNILHRDMKLENVLIDYATRKVKLIDFGYSVEIDPSLRVTSQTYL
jgi:MAP/microtubule affinity-regulating kinase